MGDKVPCTAKNNPAILYNIDITKADITITLLNLHILIN